MNLQVDIQSASAEPVPEDEDIRRWIAATLEGAAGRANARASAAADISVRLVDEAEMTALNRSYRGKNGPTNVLAFPAQLPAELALPLLGDVVICAPVVHREVAEQGKSASAHWAHMAVHGTLHLLGYDHLETSDAEDMEALESAILTSLGFDCPYADTLVAEQVPS
ncbi:MAG: rRNA maturation RNase YbeY [Halioglobus sp.]